MNANELKQAAAAALDEQRQKEKEAAWEIAAKLANGFRKLFRYGLVIDDQPEKTEILSVDPVVFQDGDLTIIAEYGVGYDVIYYLARYCDQCGYVKAGHVHNLVSLGRALETSDKEWLKAHIATHPPAISKEIVLNALMEELDKAYRELILRRMIYMEESAEKISLETIVADHLGQALLAGTITGKNETERKAAHQGANQELYQALADQINDARVAQIEYEKANLEVERLKALLRCYELAHKLEIV